MQMKKKLKESKASMSVYVLVVLFTYLIILSSIYFTLISVNKSQLSTILKIKQSYELDNSKIEQIYQTKAGGSTSGGGTSNLPDVTPTTPAGTKVKKPNAWTSTKVEAIADGKGGIVPLPNEYYYVGGNYDSGLVISDKAGDTMEASGVDMRKPVCMDTSSK